MVVRYELEFGETFRGHLLFQRSYEASIANGLSSAPPCGYVFSSNYEVCMQGGIMAIVLKAPACSILGLQRYVLVLQEAGRCHLKDVYNS